MSLWMFLVGTFIFIPYAYFLVWMVRTQHKKQEQERLNDPELREYYVRHGQEDLMDYDGMGNQGRFIYSPKPKAKKRKRGSQSRMKNYFWHENQKK